LVARAETIEADRFFSYSLKVNTPNCAELTLHDSARRFLLNTPWSVAACEPLSGDASARHYFRLRQGKQTAILMDASQNLESVATFIRIGQHLRSLGFSAPAILASNEGRGLLLLEDFGDDTFAQLLERGCLSRSGNAAAAKMAKDIEPIVIPTSFQDPGTPGGVPRLTESAGRHAGHSGAPSTPQPAQTAGKAASRRRAARREGDADKPAGVTTKPS